MLWQPCDSAQQQQEVVQLLTAMLVLAVQVGKVWICNQPAMHAICGCTSAFIHMSGVAVAAMPFLICQACNIPCADEELP